jgi:uncharacterized protein (TIGR00156 family)
MKTPILMLLAAAGLAMATAHAVPVNQQAIADRVLSVAQAKTLADDSMVQLKGHIVRAMGDEKYEFKDQTGNIVVEIDHELWQGKALQSNQLVTLIGEVDIDHTPLKSVKIDVKQVQF